MATTDDAMDTTESTQSITTTQNPLELKASIDTFVIPDLKMRIGPGLIQNKETLFATKAGFLRYSSQHKFYWIENNQKRYVPSVEDMVIGVVMDKYGESYKVDIDGSQPASLSILAFEGATRRNKLTIPVGAPVYARVAVANKDMEPEIVCVSQKNKADGFGELQGGFMFQVSLGYAARLLRNAYVLTALGKKTAFEIAVGLNGRVWINSSDLSHTIVLSNAIMSCENLDPHMVGPLVDRLWATVSK